MPCSLRKMHIFFCFLSVLHECANMQICKNLNSENKMRDIGKGTYQVVGNSGNGETYGMAAS